MVECIDRLVNTMASAQFSWTLISFRNDALAYAHRHYKLPMGWVLREYSDHSRTIASKLSPDFVFCNVKRLPLGKNPFWSGPWKWVVYDIVDAQFAIELLSLGADMVESGCIADMLLTPEIKHDMVVD